VAHDVHSQAAADIHAGDANILASEGILVEEDSLDRECNQVEHDNQDLVQILAEEEAFLAGVETFLVAEEAFLVAEETFLVEVDIQAEEGIPVEEDSHGDYSDT